MFRVNKKIHYSLGTVIFFVALVVYTYCQSRTVNFWDCGEFIPGCTFLGVPHPPGNPFYVLLGKFLKVVTFGLVEDAILINFYSGLLSAFAVLLTYLIAVKLCKLMFSRSDEQIYAYFIGVIAALLSAFSNSIWDNAIEAEVYGGALFFVNLCIWLTLVWREKYADLGGQNILLVIVYLLFLGFSFHQTALQIVPAILFVAIYPKIHAHIHDNNFWIKVGIYGFCLLAVLLLGYPIGEALGFASLSKLLFGLAAFCLLYYFLKEDVGKRVWILGAVLIVLGLSCHVLLMIRAAQLPYINESDPATWNAFVDFILRKQYGGSNFMHRNSPIGYQINFHFMRYFGQQFFYIPFISNLFKMSTGVVTFLVHWFIFLVGVAGAVFHFRTSKRSFIYFFSFVFMTTVAMIIVMNLSDHEVRNRQYFFASAYNLWTIWMAMGLVWIAYLLKEKKAISTIVLVALLAFPVVNFASMFYVHNRHNNYTAMEYAFNFLNSCEENAILFTNGDNDTFPLWYAQACYDSYSKKHEVVPPATGVVPDERTMKRLLSIKSLTEAQRKGIRPDVAVVNLSLINTPWYIKQMRDKDGVIFGWSDSEIDRLRPFYVQEDRTFRLYDEESGKVLLSTKIAKGQVMYVRDLAILQIIKNNFGKRPIYFASTSSNDVLFHEHWQDEGFVQRVVVNPDEKLGLQRAINNLLNVCMIESFEDKSYHKDSDVSRMSNFVANVFYRTHVNLASKTSNLELAGVMIDKAVSLSTGEYNRAFSHQKELFQNYVRQLESQNAVSGDK